MIIYLVICLYEFIYRYIVYMYTYTKRGGGLSKMIAPALAVLRKMRGRCANEIAEG
jgi:hypothetical protein